MVYSGSLTFLHGCNSSKYVISGFNKHTIHKPGSHKAVELHMISCSMFHCVHTFTD